MSRNTRIKGKQRKTKQRTRKTKTLLSSFAETSGTSREIDPGRDFGGAAVKANDDKVEIQTGGNVAPAAGQPRVITLDGYYRMDRK